MKKTTMAFLAIVMLVSVTSFTSCSKEKNDEDHTPTNSDKIIGTWIVTSIVTDYTYMGATSTETTDFTDDDIIEFKSDGTVVATDSGQSETGTWSLDGDKVIITDTDSEFDNTEGYDIKVLTSSDFHLYTKLAEDPIRVEATLKLRK